MVYFSLKLLFIYKYFLLVLFNVSVSVDDGLKPSYRKFVKPGEAPYVVLVDSLYTKCTGTLISDLWAVTTASCVQDADYKLREKIYVVAGILDYESKENFTSRQERSVVKTIIYPYYKDITYVSALTLLKVNESFVFNNDVRPVKTQSKVWSRHAGNLWKCSLYGYGDLDFTWHDAKLKVTNINIKNAARSCHCTKRRKELVHYPTGAYNLEVWE